MNVNFWDKLLIYIFMVILCSPIVLIIYFPAFFFWFFLKFFFIFKLNVNLALKYYCLVIKSFFFLNLNLL